MSQGKISVIIPVYNTEKYVERCLRSVMGQTYSDLEIICVNDGSSDGSGDVLDALAREDSRVKVIHKENAGVSAARNEALRHVTGEYISFVDSDDYIDQYMFEKMLNKMTEEKADVVTCRYSFDFAGEIIPAENAKEVPGYSMSMRDFLQYVYERDVYKGVASYLWTRLIKREMLFSDQNELYILFDPEFGGADDIVFGAELAARDGRIAYMKEPLYFYFQREGSIVHDEETQLKTLHWITAYEKIIDIYMEKGWLEIIELLERMLVYRCGKTYEVAMKYGDKEKAEIIRNKIKSRLPVYVKANIERLDRVKWIIDLMLQKEEE